MAFLRMTDVVGKVADVVVAIDARRHEAESHDGDQRRQQRLGIEELSTKHHGAEDEGVFHPLSRTDEFEKTGIVHECFFYFSVVVFIEIVSPPRSVSRVSPFAVPMPGAG